MSLKVTQHTSELLVNHRPVNFFFIFKKEKQFTKQQNKWPQRIHPFQAPSLVPVLKLPRRESENNLRTLTHTHTHTHTLPIHPRSQPKRTLSPLFWHATPTYSPIARCSFRSPASPARMHHKFLHRNNVTAKMWRPNRCALLTAT